MEELMKIAWQLGLEILVNQGIMTKLQVFACISVVVIVALTIYAHRKKPEAEQGKSVTNPITSGPVIITNFGGKNSTIVKIGSDNSKEPDMKSLIEKILLIMGLQSKVPEAIEKAKASLGEGFGKVLWKNVEDSWWSD